MTIHYEDDGKHARTEPTIPEEAVRDSRSNGLRIAFVALVLAALAFVVVGTWAGWVAIHDRQVAADQGEALAKQVDALCARGQVPEDRKYLCRNADKVIESTKGLQGPPGAPGIEGPPGPEGPQGVEGPQGPQGVQGPRGKQGKQGLQGLAGLMGLTGPAGPAGPQGDQGEKGEKGEKGEPGRSVTGVSATCSEGDLPTDGDDVVTFVFTFSDGTSDTYPVLVPCSEPAPAP